MEQIALVDRAQIHCLTFDHRVRAGIAVKTERPFSLFVQLDEGQRRLVAGIHDHVFCINPLIAELFL